MATEVRTVPPVIHAQEEQEHTKNPNNGDAQVHVDGTTTVSVDKANKVAEKESTSNDAASKEESEGNKDGQSKNDSDSAAARIIQQHYRGYRTRRQLNGCNISADTRWTDGIHRMRLEQANKQSNMGQNDTTSRWKRGQLLAGQLSGADKGAKDGNGTKTDEPVEGGPSLETDGDKHSVIETDSKVGDVPGANDDGKVDNIRSIAKPKQPALKLIERWTRGGEAQELSKTMECQYWLEMVDKRHRYGSNLKYYHQKWQESDTKDNFFKWLDEGEGKDVDIEDCPRERLDSECVIYLSSEQRRNYIVDIQNGMLIWRRNGKPVDTKRNKHKDLGDGRGICDLGDDEQEEARQQRKRKALERGASGSSLEEQVDGSSSESSSSSSEDGEMTSAEKTKAAQHYQSKRSGKSRHLDALKSSNWSDMLLRKTIGNNTWIYVYNSRRELYIGLKQTGYFQHSSFLYGGRVLSAGLLKVQDGCLTSLSPLSGHYRAGTAHFRYFVKSLQDSGVNLERVTLSKSLLLLAGMEQYGKMMKKAKGGGKKKEKKEKEAKAEEKQPEHSEKGGADKHDQKDGLDGENEKTTGTDTSLTQKLKQKLRIN